MKDSQDKIIVYDGICNLCISTVAWIKANDKKGKFRFMPFQSQEAERLITAKTIQSNPEESVVYINDYNVLERSDAIIQIFKDLGGFWKIFIILNVIPGFLRDRLYTFVANNRYRWFRKRNYLND